MDMSRYFGLFLAESREHLGAAWDIHGRLELTPDDPDLWREMLRHAHSLKGMAATMGFDAMVKLTPAEREPGYPRDDGGPARTWRKPRERSGHRSHT